MPLPPAVESLFPGLASGYLQTSNQDALYNCIGHAVGDSETWWDPAPGRYWPRRAPRNYSPDALIAALSTIEYSRCPNGDLEKGVEKLAIFVGSDGEYSHVARQLADGQWSSKIGVEHDISHELHQLEGSEYGKVFAFMSRRRR
jgi:hypothetical protein